MKARINTPDIVSDLPYTEIEVQVSTADLIAEIERRRPCDKCEIFTQQYPKCGACVWNGTMPYQVNFKPKQESKP